MVRQGFSLDPNVMPIAKKSKSEAESIDNESEKSKNCHNNVDVEVSDAVNHNERINKNDSHIIEEEKDEEYLKLLTWNIDGLTRENYKERTKCLSLYIKQLEPQIIHLQEITHEFLDNLECDYYISENYRIVKPTHELIHYFCVTLVSQECTDLSSSSRQYDNTSMNRGFLQTFFCYKHLKISAINTHLESCSENSNSRIEQLLECVDLLSQAAKCGYAIFLAGDLNIRDREVSTIGKSGILANDCWILSGRNKLHQYTWDPVQNSNIKLEGQARSRSKMRFDRIYFYDRKQKSIKIDDFISCGRRFYGGTKRFISDHWGAMAVFKFLK
ncbi:MAG: Tyrosyl-DNA phosphodiesterase 2 [Marteilia pararefringens]